MCEGKNAACGCWNGTVGGCLGFLAGLVVLFVAVFCLGADFNSFWHYWDAAAWVVVCGLIFSGWLVFPGFRGILCAVRVLCRGRAANAEEAQRAMWFCASGIGLAFISGVLGTLIGVINMLSGGMDSPQVLVRGMSIALLTNFYPCLFAVPLVGLYYRARQILRECATVSAEAAPLRGGWARLLIAAFVVLWFGLIFGIGLSNVIYFIYIPAMAFVFGAIFLGWLIAPGVGSWWGILRVLYRNRIDGEEDLVAARKAVAGCRLGMLLCLLGGLAGVFGGLLQALTWAGSLPNGLTNGMALLCLSLFWMAVVALPLQAFLYRARALLGAEATEADWREMGWGGLLAACSTLFALLGSLVLLGSFSIYADKPLSVESETLLPLWRGAIPFNDLSAVGAIVGVLAAGWLFCGRLPLRTLVGVGYWLTLLGGLTCSVVRVIEVLANGAGSFADLLGKISYTLTPFFWVLVLLIPLVALRARVKDCSCGGSGGDKSSALD